MATPIPTFISYAHKDKKFMDQLRTFLKPYEANNTIKVWTDKDTVAGQDWDELIKTKLLSSRLIIFLCSPDFLASDYITKVELKNAIEQRQSEAASLVPVIIRPINMNLLTIRHLQAVPSEARAVAIWPNRDEAWVDVIRGLELVFLSLNQTENNTVLGIGEILKTPGKNKITTQVVVWIIILFLVFSVGMTIFGMTQKDSYYVWEGVGGIGVSFLGMILKRFFH